MRGKDLPVPAVTLSEPVNGNLLAALARHIPSPALVALTGAGGKTTLMFSLALHVALSRAVLTTTTTKIYPPSSEEGELVLAPEHGGAWEERLRATRRLTLGAAVKKGKVLGLAPAFLDAVYERRVADCILVEADGAARLPFKAYADHEPVLPARTTLQIVVLGADVLLRPLADDNTFRLGLLAERYAIRPGTKLSVRELAFLLDHPQEYARCAVPGVPRLLVITRCGLFGEERTGELARIVEELAGLLRTYDHVYCGSLPEDVCLASFALAASSAIGTCAREDTA